MPRVNGGPPWKRSFTPIDPVGRIKSSEPNGSAFTKSHPNHLQKSGAAWRSHYRSFIWGTNSVLALPMQRSRTLLVGIVSRECFRQPCGDTISRSHPFLQCRKRDPDGSQYVIYWATTIPERFQETAKNADRGWDHRRYYKTTKDLKDYTETSLFYEPGFNVIDSTITMSWQQAKEFVRRFVHWQCVLTCRSHWGPI